MRLILVTPILAAISIIGAIPFGDPKFVDRAIALEIAFIVLTILTFKGYRKVLYICIPLSVAVIIGNLLAPPHVQIMTSFSKPLNAVLLIIGGIILQAALIVTSVYELAKARKFGMVQKQKG